MSGPEDAGLFVTELHEQLRHLDECSDILAIGYLKAMYHVAATYGIYESELESEMKAAASRIYSRLKKDDPIRVHYFISIMLSLPGLCEPEWFPELEAIVEKLNLPEFSQSFMRCMKLNVESYQRQINGGLDDTDNSGTASDFG